MRPSWRLGRGRVALLVGWVGSVVPPIEPGVGRPFHRVSRVQQAISEVREGSGGPSRWLGKFRSPPERAMGTSKPTQKG